MYSERLIITLNTIANQHKPIIQKAIEEILRQPKYMNTGAGVASVKVEVVAGDATKAPDIMISFDDYVGVLNLRKLEWTKLPNMGELLKWAETKKSDPKEAKQLAWATAYDKKKNDTWKPKLWRKKSLSEVLKEMNELIISEFDKANHQDLQDAVNI